MNLYTFSLFGTVWRSVGIELFFAEKRYATKDRFRMLKKLQELLL